MNDQAIRADQPAARPTGDHPNANRPARALEPDTTLAPSVDQEAVPAPPGQPAPLPTFARYGAAPNAYTAYMALPEQPPPVMMVVAPPPSRNVAMLVSGIILTVLGGLRTLALLPAIAVGGLTAIFQDYHGYASGLISGQVLLLPIGIAYIVKSKRRNVVTAPPGGYPATLPQS